MRAMTATVAALLLLGAICLGTANSAQERDIEDSQANMGTVKLYANEETRELMYSALPTPRVVLDGEFVGNYRDLRHNTPAHFRLPHGKHSVRVEVEGYEPFESEIHLIGNDTGQFLCVALEKK